MTKADFPSCHFLSRNEFCLQGANEQLRRGFSGHGLAEQKPLALVRTILKCSIGLSDSFDAFGGYAQIETFAETEYSSHEDIACRP